MALDIVAEASGMVAEGVMVWRRRGGGVLISCMAVVTWHDRRPSHPYNSGTKHVGFSPVWQTSLAPSGAEDGEQGDGGSLLVLVIEPEGARWGS